MTTPTEERQATTVIECPSFYFSHVVFQVEDTLFRVPRRYFEQESEIFRALFQLPVATASVADGSDNEHPLRLEGVNKEDFRQLLRMMFPGNISRGEKLTVSQGISVLKLSSMWQMDGLTEIVLQKLSNFAARRQSWVELLDLSTTHQLHNIRALAIRKISATFGGRGTDKVALARQFGVKQWLEEGLKEMVQREEPFTDEDDEMVGCKTMVKVYRLRERLHSTRCRDRRAGHANQDEAKEGVSKEFDKELNDMDGEIDFD